MFDNKLLSIKEDTSALLVGNGFSINFDSDFANIYDRLYEGHKQVVFNAELKFNKQTKEIFKRRVFDNYKSVLQFSRSFESSTFEEIINSAIDFAEFIVLDREIKCKILNHKDCSQLTFGHSHLTVAESIYKVGKEKGYKSVNIENWTGLVWLYYILVDINEPKFIEFLKYDNLFIIILIIGQINKTKIFEENHFVLEHFICNGFLTYYKLLVSATIFNNGKAINLDLLNKINLIDVEKLNAFIGNFKSLFTLNYDHIMESVTAKKVNYLHGKFILNQDIYVYHQLLKINYMDKQISFSDIKIGDFLFVKSMAPIFYNINSKKFNQNAFIIEPINEINKRIKLDGLNHFMIFGMNVENDYHILRGIMLGFAQNQVANPCVTYCYYNVEEKISFEKTWNEVITFGKDYSEYAQKINLSYIKSTEIISNYFLKR